MEVRGGLTGLSMLFATSTKDYFNVYVGRTHCETQCPTRHGSPVFLPSAGPLILPRMLLWNCLHSFSSSLNMHERHTFHIGCIGIADFHLSHYHKWWFIALCVCACVCVGVWGCGAEWLPKVAHIISEPPRLWPYCGAILLVLFQFRPPPRGWRGEKCLSIFISPPDLFWVVIKARLPARIFP